MENHFFLIFAVRFEVMIAPDSSTVNQNQMLVENFKDEGAYRVYFHLKQINFLLLRLFDQRNIFLTTYFQL